MLILSLDRESPVPAYKQILGGVVRLVDGGSLAPGDRLPPTRVLAQRIGVHRSTVLHAYEELWALGYLESRPGSYSTVRRRPRTMATRAASPETAIDWQSAATPAARAAQEAALRLARLRPSPHNVVDFSRLAGDRNLAPAPELQRCLRSALLAESKDLLDYGEPAGYRPLRETIARRMRIHGVSVSADEVAITGGAQQALDLAIRTLTRPGDRIVTESPTYSGVLPLLRFHGLEPREIPMRQDGMDLDALERLLANERPALLYTIPNFHNPTGITTSQAHRERLLALCEAHRLPILEDGFEEEMKYFGKAVLPIKSMDSRGLVLYVGTFSKVVFPGLRIGWIAAPRACTDVIIAVQRTCCLSGNSLAQAAVHRFCEQGLYEAHLRRLHKAYRRRMQAMLHGLAEHLPAERVSWTEPQGGYTLWLRVAGWRHGEAELYDRLLRDGVKVSPGSLFFSQPPPEPHFRLSIACLGEGEIVEGCRRLGRSLRAALEG